MKKTKIILVGTILFASCFITSCTDSFLDLNPQTSLSADMAIGNVADAQVALNGVYDGMQSSAFYYARNFIVSADVMGDDVNVSPQNSGRFLAQYNYSIIPANADFTNFWNRAWNVINRANNVISKIGNIEDGTQAQRDQIYGEALTLRALAHFDLARYFAKPYTWDAQELCIPYMLEPMISEPSRETNAYVYGKIVEDLAAAINLLTLPRPKAFVSTNVAKAILARVYLYMERFEEAALLAEEVINGGAYTLLTNANYLASWSLEFNSESIFSLAMSNIDYSATDALGYIYVERGYGDLLPSQEIIDLLENAGGTAPGADVRFNAFLKWEPGKNAFYVNKFPGRGGQAGMDNVPVIRLSELYLIAAEGFARKANPDYVKARNFLNAIRKRGNAGAADITLEGPALLDFIYLEKRIEFAFEGHRFFDIRRRKESVIRGGDCTASVCLITHGDNKLVLPIPQREIDANPNMLQNPGYDN